MKKDWKRIIAAGCIAALLMTGPGVTVLGAELQEQAPSTEVISEEPLDEEREDIEAEEQSVITDASAEDAALKNDEVVIPGAGQVEIEETNVAEEEIGSGEETDLQEAETPDEVENVLVDEDAETEIDDLLEDDSSQEGEELVGPTYHPILELPVGENVYATITRGGYYSGSEYVATNDLTLSVPAPGKNGTLYSDWQERITNKIPNDNWKESLLSISVYATAGKLYFPEISGGLFMDLPNLKSISFSNIDTSRAQTMNSMFRNCESLTSLDLSGFDVSQVIGMAGMFYNCKSLKKLNLSNFNSPVIWWVNNMFEGCTSLEELDISSLSLLYIHMEGEYMEIPAGAKDMFKNCSKLKTLKTPPKATSGILLPKTMYDSNGKSYTELPNTGKSIVLKSTATISISGGTIYGVTRSYGYTGSPHTPDFMVVVNGKTLTAGTDYTYKFTHNINPGVGTLTVTGKGDYKGTLTQKFLILKCVDVPQDGHTYRLVPKNNPEAVLCAAGGNMVNNTKVTITSPNTSEAQKFVVRKYADGKYKIFNAKSITAVAVQQNSNIEGKGVVIYQETTREAQKWILARKADNSYAIVNAVTGFSISSPDQDATIGSQLIVKKTAASSLQRFYFVEAEPVLDEFGGRYTIACRKDSNYVVDIAGGSTAAGANAQLYKSNGTDAQKFDIVYSGSGYYRLVNKKSGLVLTVKDDSAVSGANVEQRAWQGLNGQRWWLKYNEEDGTVTMRNRLGTYLHLTSNKVQNGTNICAKTEAATTAQRWRLKPS